MNRAEIIASQLNEDLKFVNSSRNEKLILQPGATWSNFAQIGSCKPEQFHYPSSVAEVQHLLKSFHDSKKKCRIVGCGKSPNGLTFTNEQLVFTSKMSKILNLNQTSRTITCEGGALLFDVLRVLDANGLMLRCVPSIVDISVAGAIATGTHSSGITSKSLSAYVTSLTFVNGKGDLVTYSAVDTPRELSIAACHLGLLGFVTSVTLQAERKCQWHLKSDKIGVDRIPKVLAQRVMTSDYYRFWWTPHTNQCYEAVGKRLDTEDVGGTQSNAGKSTLSAASKVSASTALGKFTLLARTLRRAVSNESERHLWELQEASLTRSISKAVRGPWLHHNVVESALRVSNEIPALQPCINTLYQKVFLNEPQELYGSALEVFTFDCLFRQWACEWAIDAQRALEAFDILRQLVEVHHLKLHFPVEFRFVGEDNIAMSPANGRVTCWIGVVMYKPFGKDAPDTLKVYNLFSQAMQKIGGRPHWAKYYNWRHRDVQAAYGDNWKSFLSLAATMDPQSIFVNEHMKTLMTAN